MKIFSSRPVNIIQPLNYAYDPHPVFKQTKHVLLDKPARWRKQSNLVHLSYQGRLRLEWMIFYETAANKDAYATARHFGISPKTFYKWWQRFDRGKLRNLEDHSKVPKRKRHWQVSLQQELRIRKLRAEHLHYGRRKLQVLYQKEYTQEISLWKIERVIRKHGLYPDQRKAKRVAWKRALAKLKPKRRIQDLTIKPDLWFLVHLDGITIHWQGLKCYILTAVDHQGKFGYARMYASKSSRSAKDFLYRLKYVVDAPIINIQTDNGSEFYHEFEQALQELEILHWFSRPKTPKDNAMAERFNETLQYEWLNDGNFTSDVDQFNHALTDWLIEYNFHRPHQALDYLTPIEYIQANNKDLLPMWSVRTNP